MSYRIIAPTTGSEDNVRRQKVLPAFDDSILAFTDALSARILSDARFRRFPELMAMAFWMRRANIVKLREKFEQQKSNRTLLGRGIAFHIAPSNVDTIFVYSWFLSMLMGNVNVVRLSSELDEQVTQLVSVINDLACQEAHRGIGGRFLIVQYEHNDEVTSRFSSYCDIRVIWGGDQTIQKIRSIPLKPTAVELVFADKFSMSVVGADAFLKSENVDKIVERFYNDAFWFGQNACSSPRLVVWLGEEEPVGKARAMFWAAVVRVAGAKLGSVPAAVAVNKLVAIDSLALESDGDVDVESSQSSLVSRVLLEKARDVRRDLHCGGGLFYELRIASLDDLEVVITAKDQTIGSFGISAEDWRTFVEKHRPEGISRIVPIGEALTFSAVWDGYDLLREFCREVDVAL